MPESGETSFALYFPPLDPSVRKIDFIESDCDDCFKIWGISLLPNTKIKMAELNPSTSLEPLPEPKFSNEKAILKGRINGMHEGMSKKLEVYYGNPLDANMVPHKIELNTDGTFHSEIPIGFPGIVYTNLLGDVFLAPGKETNVMLDLKKKNRYQSRYRTDKQASDSLFFFIDGPGVTANDMDLMKNITGEGYFSRQSFKDAAHLTPETLKEHLYAIKEKSIQEAINNNLNQDLIKLISAKADIEITNILINAKNFIKQGQMMVQDIPYEKWDSFETGIPEPDENYYSFLKELLTDDLTYYPEFTMLMQQIRDSEIIQQKINKEEKASEFEMFQNALHQLMGKKPDGLIAKTNKLQLLAKRIYNQDFYLQEEHDFLYNSFENPAYAKVLIAENQKVKSIIESTMGASGTDFVINQVPDVGKEDVFESILANYPDKMIVIDFWATWCGPCIYANEQMKAVKKDYNNEDIVFIYLTGETSPINTWSEMIPDIKGEHYRVNKDQWDYWYTQFNIEGVPTIMIYDKEQKMTDRFTGFPGVTAIKESIEKSIS